MTRSALACDRCGLREVRHELERRGVVVRFCDECYWGEMEAGAEPGPMEARAPEGGIAPRNVRRKTPGEDGVMGRLHVWAGRPLHPLRWDPEQELEDIRREVAAGLPACLRWTCTTTARRSS
jgi:hypothetical protein